MVGSAVGDALGAPFEFGPAGAFSARFPTSVAPSGQVPASTRTPPGTAP
ncbi:ADP-ribosylglycohydrolase family protein [Actinocrispum wychmicini]